MKHFALAATGLCGERSSLGPGGSKHELFRGLPFHGGTSHDPQHTNYLGASSLRAGLCYTRPLYSYSFFVSYQQLMLRNLCIDIFTIRLYCYWTYFALSISSCRDIKGFVSQFQFSTCWNVEFNIFEACTGFLLILLIYHVELNPRINWAIILYI